LALVKLHLAVVGRLLALVSGVLAVVGHLLALVSGVLALVGQLLVLIRSPVAFIRNPVAFVGDPVALGAGSLVPGTLPLPAARSCRSGESSTSAAGRRGSPSRWPMGMPDDDRPHRHTDA
jgi:hypothetical protein